MRPRIFIRGSIRPSVGPSVRPSVTSYFQNLKMKVFRCFLASLYVVVFDNAINFSPWLILIENLLRLFWKKETQIPIGKNGKKLRWTGSGARWPCPTDAQLARLRHRSAFWTMYVWESLLLQMNSPYDSWLCITYVESFS